MTGLALETAQTTADAAAAATTATPGTSADNSTAKVAATATPGVNAGTSDPVVAAKTDSQDPWASLSAEDKAWVTGKNWKTEAERVKSHRELEVAFSGKLDALVPKDASAYTFTKPTDAEALKYDDKFVGLVRQLATGAKLMPDQAGKLHDALLDTAREAMKGQSEAAIKARDDGLVAAERELVATWGKPGTPGFDRNLELSRRAIEQSGLADDLKAAGFITDVDGTPKIAHAKVFAFMAKVGQQMYAEDRVFGKAATTSNPFDPATLDLFAQSKVYKENPAQARALISALPIDVQARYSHLLGKLSGAA